LSKPFDFRGIEKQLTIFVTDWMKFTAGNQLLHSRASAPKQTGHIDHRELGFLKGLANGRSKPGVKQVGESLFEDRGPLAHFCTAQFHMKLNRRFLIYQKIAQHYHLFIHGSPSCWFAYTYFDFLN
jgi:hypothetical protein